MIATLVSSSWMDMVGKYILYMCIYLYIIYCMCVWFACRLCHIFQVHLQLENLQPSSTQRCLWKFQNFIRCLLSHSLVNRMKNRQERGCDPSIRMPSAYSKSWRGGPIRKWGGRSRKLPNGPLFWRNGSEGPPPIHYKKDASVSDFVLLAFETQKI